MTRRLLLSMPLLLSILFLPYFVYAPLLILGAIFIPLYWEGIILGFLIDSLYGGAHDGLSLYFPFAITALLVTLVMIPLRKQLRFNA